ncbi:hypothetical protein BH10PSE12_BH10PSE12_00300 [soil metagenome]
MTNGGPVFQPRSIVDRAKAIILKPKEEWPVIAAEPTTIKDLYTGYAMILAAIPVLAMLIGGQVFGFGGFGFNFRPPLIGSIAQAIVHYVLTLVVLYLIALVIDYLAPTFGGKSNRVQAFKVATYSGTAGWLAGIVYLVPALSILGIVALYGLYLLYTGLPILMQAPADKAMPYTVVTILVGAIGGAILFALIGLLTAPLMMMGGAGMLGSTASTESGTVTVPGMGTIDLDKMKAASAKMEAAAKQMETAAKTGEASGVTDPTALQAFLPEAIGGYKRTEVSSAGLGVGGSHAEGRYEAGDRSFRVEITDMAAMGALTGMGAAMNVQSNKETATGYEKTQTLDGQLVTEEWDKTDNNGKFSTTVANRFMVEASGQAASIDELKAAVAAVGPAKLAALAK